MARSVEQIEARLQAAAARAEQRALGRLSRLVQPAARRRAGAELGRARAAAARAPAQAERIAQRQAVAHAKELAMLAAIAQAVDPGRRSTSARKAAATRAERTAQAIAAHNAQRQLNRNQGFAPPPPLQTAQPSTQAARWFRDRFPVGNGIFKKSYTVAAVTRSKGGAVLTITRADGQLFYIGVVRGADGKPRFTARQLTMDDARADLEALANDY